jgi:hypothetical protein
VANYSAANRQRLQRLIDESYGLGQGDFTAWRQRAQVAIGAVYGDPSPQLERFDAIRWTLGIWTDSTPNSEHAAARQRGLNNAVSMLRAFVEDIDAHLATPELPGLDPSQFHPWVAGSAAALWADGHRQQAVQTAAAMIETRLKVKLGVHTGSVASLVASAFSTKEPVEGQPRLRFDDVGAPGSETFISAHEGAGAFGRGCMLRVRNLYTHASGADEQEDLEALAALSLLARWIDSARLVTAA